MIRGETIGVLVGITGRKTKNLYDSNTGKGMLKLVR